MRGMDTNEPAAGMRAVGTTTGEEPAAGMRTDAPSIDEVPAASEPAAGSVCAADSSAVESAGGGAAPVEPASGSQGGTPPSHSRRQEVTGVVATLVGGSCWGISGTMASMLFDGYGVGTMWLLSVRQICAGLMFMVFDLIFCRQRLVKLWTTREHRRTLLVFAFCGLLPNQLFYLVAVRYTNAGTATVLQYLQLLFVLAYNCIKDRRAPTAREGAGVVLAIAGTFLIATGGDPTSLSISPAGLAAGIVCALATAGVSIIPAKILPEYGSPVVTGSAMFTSGLVTSAIMRPWSDVPDFDVQGWVALAIFVVLGSFMAYLLYLEGVKDIGGMRASLLGTMEPVVATVSSAVLLGTVFTATDLVGFALIIVMMFFTV